MAAPNYETARDDASLDEMYLPAVSLPPQFGRIEAFVEDLFDLHGVVLVPDRDD